MSVYVGIPSYDAKLHWTTAQGLVGLTHFCAKNGIGIAVDVIPHDAYIGKARSTVVNRFMASGMENLMFIDADVGFEPQGVIDLCTAAPDIVMGLYLMKTTQARYPALLSNPVVRHPSDMRLVKIIYGPAGFLRIRRRVIETMKAKWPEEYYIDGVQGKVHDLFPHGRYEHHFTGEDIIFCERAITCGFDLWAMQRIRLRHFGERSWDSQWQIDAEIPGTPKVEMGGTDGYQGTERKVA